MVKVEKYQEKHKKEYQRELQKKQLEKKNSLKKIKNFIKEMKEKIEKKKKSEKYYDRDDPDYYRMRKIGDFTNEIDEEDYYKPTKTKSAFNNNYIEYKSRGDKDENLSPEQYLDMIGPYLRDMIDNHKAPKKIKN